jgi:hypothetical protein
MVSDSYAASYADKAADGIYYNGGSWMRVEICGYVTGKLHGWKRADRAIANRLWAETHADDDFPTSQEYLPTCARKSILRISPGLFRHLERIRAACFGIGRIARSRQSWIQITREAARQGKRRYKHLKQED